MHQMIKKAWILVACCFFLGALNDLSAQAKKCFEDVRQDGLVEFKKRNYNRAIDSYIAALNCPDKPLENDLYDLIRQAQKAIDTDLLVKSEAAKKAVAEAAEAGEEVKKAQDLADKAKNAEALAKVEAEKNAAIARAQSKQAEMLRLAILSDNLRTNNKAGDALFLAFLSTKLNDKWPISPAQMRAFSQAVWDTLNHPLAQSAQSFNAIYPLANGQDYLAVQDQQQLVFLSKGKSSPVQTGKDTLILANAIARSGDNYLLGSTSGRAWLWNASTNVANPIEAHTASVLSTNAAADGQSWLTTSRDKQAKLWSKDGQLKGVFPDKVNTYNALFSPDGQSILTRSADGSLKLWNLGAGTFIQLPNAPAYSYVVLFSEKGNRILAGGHDGKLYRWDLKGNSLPNLTLHHSPIRQLHVSQQKRFIYSIAADSSMALLSPEGDLFRKANYSEEGHEVLAVLDPKDQFMATADADHNIYLEHFERGEVLLLSGHQAEITSLAFSPDGQSLLSTSADGVLRLWDIYGNLWMELNTGDNDTPPIAAFSGDGKNILVSSEGNKTLLECPMPKLVLNEMNQKEKALAGRIEEVKRKYGVKFME
ncbi:WD40 repeat domain-containing protein [Haliscomenobacter sp.]|uniref:WD40 repeat domain-containing protein n=1 Tax=Haliscomenobacter sp. TaxID=2717303 RepID=UPI003BA9DDAB